MNKFDKVMLVVVVMVAIIAIGVWVASLDVLGWAIVGIVGLATVYHLLMENCNTIIIEIVDEREG